MDVTPEDRDAVFAWQNASSHAPNKLAQAFAAHRQSGYLRGVEDERARIVAWLQTDDAYCLTNMEMANRIEGAKPHD